MSQRELSIRAADSGDANVITAFNCAMAAETERRRLDEPIVQAGVRDLLGDPEKGGYFLAEREGRIVGQLMLTYEWSDWRNGTFWWIQSVYVAPDHRRKGVYRALHEFVERRARQTPAVCGVRLYVDSDNGVAQQTYRRLGMRETGYRLYETDWSDGGANDG